MSSDLMVNREFDQTFFPYRLTAENWSSFEDLRDQITAPLANGNVRKMLKDAGLTFPKFWVMWTDTEWGQGWNQLIYAG